MRIEKSMIQPPLAAHNSLIHQSTDRLADCPLVNAKGRMNNGSRKHFRSVRPPASSIDVLLLWPPNIIGCPEGGTTIVGRRRPPSLTTAAVTFKLDGWTLSLIDVRVLLLFIRFPRQQATTTTIMLIFLRTVRGVSLFTAQTRLKINKLPHMKGRQSASQPISSMAYYCRCS